MKPVPSSSFEEKSAASDPKPIKISKAYVRAVSNYLVGIPVGEEFRAALRVSSLAPTRLSQIGFAANPEHGDTVLPASIGPATRFNAHGSWIIHRDQPKENRYIRTVHWKWRQWSGRDSVEHEDFRDIIRPCYPRTLVTPPGIELTVIKTGDNSIISAPPFINEPANNDHIAHVINMLLEIGEECELLRADLTHFSSPQLRRINWTILPPGSYPWERINAHIDGVFKYRSDSTKRVVVDRQKTLLSFKPDEIHIGLGGFSNYIAYLFQSKGIVVLESIRRDNAIYVFGTDWIQFAHLSKSEIINGNLQKARIVHTQAWKAAVAEILKD